MIGVDQIGRIRRAYFEQRRPLRRSFGRLGSAGAAFTTTGRRRWRRSFVGKARQYNRRFLQMCSHHLIGPVACTPASGWEKGQVENQVGNLRDQMFRPKPRVLSRRQMAGTRRSHSKVDAERALF
jgi:hypothetical protein